MEPIPASAERSVRRSRVRLRILLALASLGEAYVGQLARMTGIPRSRVKGALLGYEPEFRVDLSLVALGLARVVETPHGRHFAITTRGRRKARSLARRLRARPLDGVAQVTSSASSP